MESPYVTNSISDINVFNMTATYRWDSDIPSPYAYFMEYKTPLSRIERNYATGKNKKVAWFVSNCHAMNNRLAYAKELAKHISVDIYGQCGDLQCSRIDDECYQMLKKDYKFYLAFENANCIYYITEKLFYNSLWLVYNTIFTFSLNILPIFFLISILPLFINLQPRLLESYADVHEIM